MNPITFMKRNSETSTSNSNREPLLMTPEDVAYEFSVDRRTVLKWAREGKLDCIRRSKKIIRFNREYIKSLERSGAEYIESPSTNKKTEDWVKNSSTTKKKGDIKASRKSWRSLREEVTKCQ